MQMRLVFLSVQVDLFFHAVLPDDGKRNRWHMSAKKTAFYGMFLALALVAGYIEQLIPINLGIPGVKLGLANIVTMLLLYIVGVPAACLISVLRILLSGFLFGSGFAMVYSAAGAAMSMLVMALLKQRSFLL